MAVAKDQIRQIITCLLYTSKGRNQLFFCGAGNLGVVRTYPRDCKRI